MNKIAVIEIGTASLRLMLINTKEGGFFNVIEEIEEPIQLGKDVERDGLLKSVRINESITVLKMFRKICDLNKVSKIIAVATSLVRNAKNQNSFLDEIYNTCGFYVTVLSPEEEMKAVYSGVVNTLDIPKGIIFDISSSAIQIVQYNRRYILNQVSLPFGALTLAELFSSEGPENSKKCAKMCEFLKKELNKVEFLQNIEPEFQFVGSGITFKSLGKLARKTSRYSLDIENNFVLGKELFDSVFDFIKTLDLDKTKKIKGVTEDRADVLVSGLSIVKSIFEKVAAEKITIAKSGMREGLIYNYVVPETNDKPLSDMIGYSLENIRKFYDDDFSNTTQVYNLAIILFKQFKVIHKLHRFYVKPLRIAASMYDCGKRIGFDSNENNSFDVILNSNINGISQRELLLAAFVSKCQVSDNFNLSDWIKFKDIFTEDDLDAVRKLGVIVKLAAALDRTRGNVVKDISCDILGDSVIMKTIVEKDAAFEIMEAKKVATDFRKVFKKFLEVI
ncbi:MAG: Ppx/GppA phosphatase family protein [Clostridia bacterium]